MTGAVGTTKDVTATVAPDGASQAVNATSSDDKIATVKANGSGGYTVTLVAKGTASIDFVTAGLDTVKASLAVTVSAATAQE